MNDPTKIPPHDPRRLTGVPEIDGTTEPPFKLTTQVGTVDLVLLDNEGEPHKIGEAEVVQGHITAHIDDDDAVRYLSGGPIAVGRHAAERQYPVEPILVHTPEGQISIGHTCDMPGGLQITLTDHVLRGPMMAALAEIKAAASEGREPREDNVDAAFKDLEIGHRKLEGVVPVKLRPGGFTPRTEVSEVGPATFDAVDPFPVAAQMVEAAIEWCLTNAGRGLAAELAQDAARHLREKWATRSAGKLDPLTWALATALHVGAETAIAWAEEQDRRLRRAPDPKAAPAAEVAGCTGDVPPGAEAVESRFVELFYLDGARMGLRFEGLPDIYVPDTDAHRLAIAVVTGNADLDTLRYEPGPNGYDLPRKITLELSHAAEGHEDEAYKPELHVALRHLVAAIARTKVLERSLEAYKRARSVVDQGQDRIDAMLNGPALRGRNEGASEAERTWTHPSVGVKTEDGTAQEVVEGQLTYLPITHIDPGPHQLGRRLMTVDDFRTPEEFQIYRAGADRLPHGILPGSWEGHLLTAMAAMVAAGVGLHEARMQAPPASDLSQRLSDAGTRGRRLWAQGGSTEAIREYVLEAANLLDAAAEKYEILAGLQRGAEKRVAVKIAEADKALNDRHQMRAVLLSARGGDADHMAKAITRALALIGGGSVAPPLADRGQGPQGEQHAALELLGWNGREAPAKFVFTHKQRLAAVREALRQARGGSSAQMTEAIAQALGMLGEGSAESTPAQPVKGAL